MEVGGHESKLEFELAPESDPELACLGQRCMKQLAAERNNSG